MSKAANNRELLLAADSRFLRHRSCPGGLTDVENRDVFKVGRCQSLNVLSLLPELSNGVLPCEPLFIWEVHHAEYSILISMGTRPMSIVNRHSIDPHRFIVTASNN